MKKFSFLAIATLMGATLAARQDVRYNFAQREDFSKYKTYKWVDARVYLQIFLSLISNSIVEILME